MQMFDPSLKGWIMRQLAAALAVAGLGRPVFVPRKEAVDCLVIDHVEKPGAN